VDVDDIAGPLTTLLEILRGRRPEEAARARRIRSKLELALRELGIPEGAFEGGDGLERVEQAADRLLAAVGAEWTIREELPEAALEALRRGKEVEAIYHYRRATGASLKEAKGMMTSLTPEQIAPPSS
jgi:hypothetical protein